MKSKRFLRCILFAALMIGLVPAAMMAAEGDIVMNGTPTGGTVVVNSDTNTITVTGNAVLNGSGGDAITINDDATMNFEQGATLTVTGYDNAFVIENGTLTGGGWHVIDGDGLDLFRLKTGGKLDITSDVDLDGNGSDITTSRAIVLPGSSSDQAVTLGEGCTLAANNFYRAIETGGAVNYSIDGENKATSIFDFSENGCGMALSYFDQQAHFNDCTFQVENCDQSGIFMRQDNGHLQGLYIDNVIINCLNDDDWEQTDIAVRFHSGDFEITNSEINIANAWTTGLWICDSWNKPGTRLIENTEINVDTVRDADDSELYGNASRRKAITLVPFADWTIKNCDITMKGNVDESLDIEEPMELGINIASDVKISGGLFDLKATPSYKGGKIILEGTKIETENIMFADIGVQVGQFLEIGDNTSIINEYDRTGEWGANPHYTVLCDNPQKGYQVMVLNQYVTINYETAGLTADQASPDRVTVSGGSYWSSPDQNLNVLTNNAYFESLPNNSNGDELSMFTVLPEQYSEYMQNGVNLMDSTGNSYQYLAENPSANNLRYIWAYPVTVTLVNGDESTQVSVPCGAPYGLTQTLTAGEWMTEDNQAFTEDSTVNGDLVITLQ